MTTFAPPLPRPVTPTSQLTDYDLDWALELAIDRARCFELDDPEYRDAHAYLRELGTEWEYRQLPVPPTT